MHSTINFITLPFIGHINLSGGILTVFLLCLFAVVAFEFVNGFHDTANAVATVIYTKALKPIIAVPWSGLFNFLGVFTGGITVAMGILKLIPMNELMALPVEVGACLVLSVLLSSIIWNLGTWWLGIPCSSSHTLIGAMIGASLAFTFYYGGVGVNWEKAKEIGLSLVLSPVLGFGLSVLLMLFLKHVVKSKELFHIPHGENDRPPIWIRALLITTCSLVSFFHGSNDGQKGVGLLMLILIAFLPAKYATDHAVSAEKLLVSLKNIEQPLNKISTSSPNNKKVAFLSSLVANTKVEVAKNIAGDDNPKKFKFRNDIQAITKDVDELLKDKELNFSKTDKTELEEAHKKLINVTDYAPLWVIAVISISLGIGTMIGWKRIVVTIGEKIGNEHLNYAQGATAEIIAASTIGLSTQFGLPVSTTHVLSSGIAGAMVASGGKNNLNNGTLKNIAMAWVLTLPVSIAIAIALFALFHLFV